MRIKDSDALLDALIAARAALRGLIRTHGQRGAAGALRELEATLTAERVTELLAAYRPAALRAEGR